MFSLWLKVNFPFSFFVFFGLFVCVSIFWLFFVCVFVFVVSLQVGFSFSLCVSGLCFLALFVVVVVCIFLVLFVFRRVFIAFDFFFLFLHSDGVHVLSELRSACFVSGFWVWEPVMRCLSICVLVDRFLSVLSVRFFWGEISSFYWLKIWQIVPIKICQLIARQSPFLFAYFS